MSFIHGGTFAIAESAGYRSKVNLL